MIFYNLNDFNDFLVPLQTLIITNKHTPHKKRCPLSSSNFSKTTDCIPKTRLGCI